MKPLKFESGELVKLGPQLWSDVYEIVGKKWQTFFPESALENQFVLYIECRDLGDNELLHKVLFDNKFYIITDNSYAIDEDSKRNLQKVNCSNDLQPTNINREVYEL